MVNLSINIAGRAYPIKVEAEEEATEIQNVVSDINEKIHTFQKTYARIDKQDTLAMALLTYLLDTKKAAPPAVTTVAVAEQPITAPITTTHTIPPPPTESSFPTEVVEQLLSLDAYLDQLLAVKKPVAVNL
jgi:Cell division protein ZapA